MVKMDGPAWMRRTSVRSSLLFFLLFIASLLFSSANAAADADGVKWNQCVDELPIHEL